MFVCDCCEAVVQPHVKSHKRMKTVREPSEQHPKAVVTEVLVCPDCAEMLNRTIPYAAVQRIRRDRVRAALNAQQPIELKTTNSTKPNLSNPLTPLGKYVQTIPRDKLPRKTRR
jgi:hypothetical protein